MPAKGTRPHAAKWEQYQRLTATQTQATPGLWCRGGPLSGPRQHRAVVAKPLSRTIPGGGVPRGGFPSGRHATATRLAIGMEGLAPPKDQGGDARIPGPNERTGSPRQNSGSGGAPSDRASYSAKVRPHIGAPLLVLDKCPRPVHLPGLPFSQGRWASATGGHNGRFC